MTGPLSCFLQLRYVGKRICCAYGLIERHLGFWRLFADTRAGHGGIQSAVV